MCGRNNHLGVHSKCGACFCLLPLQMGAVEAQCRITLASYNFLCDWSDWSKLALVIHVVSLESDPCASVGSFFCLVEGGIHVDVPYWDCGIFQVVIVHWHLQEYFYKNYTTKVSHLSESTLGVSFSWEPCITECMQWRMCICSHIRILWKRILWRFKVITLMSETRLFVPSSKA